MEWIVKTEDVMGGAPRIEGRRISVLQVYEMVYEGELGPEEVAEKFDLDMSAVYAALQYYFENVEEMEALREKYAEIEREARKDAVTPPKPA